MVIVAALYQFKANPEFEKIREPLKKFCETNSIKGTLLLASEGINGTVAADRAAIDNLCVHLKQLGFDNLEYKESFAETNPFLRIKIKLKKEIVTMGENGADPTHLVGTYVAPKDWNQLISRPDVITIDTRNDYEVQVGTFKGAVNPHTKTFREFTTYTKQELIEYKDKPVAMYCTGGIRCERSTAYLKSLGFNEVYHLKGGILKYLEEVPESESLWQGECFVFDERVTVKHGLELGEYSLCRGCRMPISKEDQKSAYHKEGVHCVHCHDKYDDDHFERMAERQKQVELAAQRGEKHIGRVRP